MISAKVRSTDVEKWRRETAPENRPHIVRDENYHVVHMTETGLVLLTIKVALMLFGALGALGYTIWQRLL